jgi:hypothetical protein
VKHLTINLEAGMKQNVWECNFIFDEFRATAASWRLRMSPDISRMPTRQAGGHPRRFNFDADCNWISTETNMSYKL